MCRLLGYCAAGEVPVASLIGDEGFHQFTALSAMHSDGWGMAWYEAGQPQIRKSPLRADETPEYDKLAQQPLGDLGLLHFRWATPGLGINDRNCHPFSYGPYAMAHNGAIHPHDRLHELLPPEWERQLVSTTDSERYFLGIMSRLAVHDGDMAAAIAGTAAANGVTVSPSTYRKRSQDRSAMTTFLAEPTFRWRDSSSTNRLTSAVVSWLSSGPSTRETNNRAIRA